MALLSFIPELLDEAEKLVPGHGVELVEIMDVVSTASFFLGFGMGIVSVFLLVFAWSAFRSARD